MVNFDDLLIKSYWLLREMTCYRLLSENAILLKDTTSLYLNLITYYYQVANKTLYTKIEKDLFYEKHIKRYLYVFLVFPKIKPLIKRKSFSEFIFFYGKKGSAETKTDRLSTIWETLPKQLDLLTLEEMVKINEQ